MEVTLQSVAAKVAALDTTQLEGLEAARADISNDLNTLIAAAPSPTAAVTLTGVSVTSTFSDGSSALTSVPLTPAPAQS